MWEKEASMIPAISSPAPWSAWVEAAQQGDRDAFGEIVDATRNLVCSIAVAIVGDRTRSEDVAQEVLVAVWRGLPTLRDPASFLPWLRQLTRNRAHESVRQALRQRRLHDRHGQEASSLAGGAAEAPAPDVLLERRSDAAVLAEGLAALPDEAREVLTLYYREGRSVEQVATLLGLSPAALRKRLQRAREQLRSETLERLGEAARRTAPGAAFSAAIAAAIGLGAPTTAAAAGASAAATAGTGWKLLVGGVAMLPGLLLGLTGILLPLRGLVRRALDARERRQLRTLAAISAGSLVLFLVAVQVTLATGAMAPLLAGYAVMQTAFIVLYGFWLPRIQRRRHAVERAADPAAARRHRRERFWGIFGLVVGSAAGAGTIQQLIARLWGTP
jgi:RNA polymerase sigma factor (sigma-70 family)